VTDRFHLLQNVAAVLTQVFTAHASQLASVHAERAAVPTPIHDPAFLVASLERPAVPLPLSSRPPQRHDGPASGVPDGGPPTSRCGHVISRDGFSMRSQTGSASVGAPSSGTSKARRFPNGSPDMIVIGAVLIPINPFSWQAGTTDVGTARTYFARLNAKAFRAGMAWSPYMSDGSAKRRAWRHGNAAAISPSRR
jgi:hypothetical protein